MKNNILEKCLKNDGLKRYLLMYQGKAGSALLADCETSREALGIMMEAYRQDKKDGCYEKGCYSVSRRF